MERRVRLQRLLIINSPAGLEAFLKAGTKMANSSKNFSNKRLIAGIAGGILLIGVSLGIFFWLRGKTPGSGAQIVPIEAALTRIMETAV